MRKLIYPVLVYLLSAISLSAQINNPEARKLAEDGIREHDKGNFEKAISLYEEALKLEPGNEVIIYEMCYSYSELKNYSTVVSMLSEIIEKGNVKNGDLYVLLGNTYDFMGDPYKAIETYTAGLEKFPNSGYMYYNYGITLSNQKRYEEALEKFEKGIAVDPSYASNFYSASQLLKNSNEPLWSLIYAEIFINLKPGDERSATLSETIYDYYKNRIKKTEKGYNISINSMAPEGGQSAMQRQYDVLMLLGVQSLADYGINIKGFSHLRNTMQTIWNEKDEPGLRNIVFERAKEIQAVNKDYLTCYNFLMMAYAAPEEFEKWYNENQDLFDKFADWMANNPLEFTPSTKYYRQQYE